MNVIMNKGRMVMIKDMKTGVTSVLYDAISTLASLKPLTLRLDHDEVLAIMIIIP